MAWTTRDHHRRRLEQAQQDIDKPLLYLKEFQELYRKDHPELAAAACGIAEMLILAQETLLKLKEAF